MALRFSVPAFQISPEDLEAAFPAVAAAGFSGIEAHDTVVSQRGSAQISRIRERAEQNGVPFTSYHLPFGERYDIGCFYESERREAVARVGESMRMAALLGAPVVIQHPASRLASIEIEPPERYREQLLRSLQTLVPLAQELRLRIAIENMMQHEHLCYFSLPEHIRDLAEAVDDSSVGFCLDTGHALISLGRKRQLEVMEAMGDRVIAFHLQDTSGDRDLHLAPGRGFVDFAGVFARAAAIGFDDVMCIEAPPFAPTPYTQEAWREMVNTTRKLAG